MDLKLNITCTLLVFLILMYIFLSIKKENYAKFLVSMDKKRKENIVKNIEVDDIHAINGYVLDIQKMIEQGLISNNKLKKGEIGCYLSHVHFINKALKENQPVLILEDDIKINNDILNKIENVLKIAPKDYEILHIGFSYHESFQENIKIERAKLVYGTHAYIINPKNITPEKVKKLFPIDKAIDMKLPTIFKSYIVWPRIIELDDNFSKFSITNIP